MALYFIKQGALNNLKGGFCLIPELETWLWCSLSSSLFNCYVDKYLKEVKLKLDKLAIEIKVGSILILMIRFAGGIVLIEETEYNF